MAKKGVSSPVDSGNKGIPPSVPSGGKGPKSPVETGNKGVPPMTGAPSRPAPKD